MARTNRTTPVATDTDTDVTATDTNVTDTDTATVTDTDARDTTTDTADDAPRYVPTLDTIVNAWRTGDIRRDAARSFITSTMTASIMAGDTATAMHAATVMTELDDAVRRPAERAFDVAPYVAATVARIVAMHDAAESLASATVIPSDIPDAHVGTFRDAIRDAIAGITVGGDAPESFDGVRATDHYTGARANADGYASNRVVGTADVSRHLADIVAGRSTDRAGNVVPGITPGTWMSFATIAGHITPEYPVTVARPNGAVAARFRRNGAVVASPPAGWVYASHNNTHGARYTGVTVAPRSTDATITDATADDIAAHVNG
jgi:hypothetical protein